MHCAENVALKMLFFCIRSGKLTWQIIIIANYLQAYERIILVKLEVDQSKKKLKNANLSKTKIVDKKLFVEILCPIPVAPDHGSYEGPNEYTFGSVVRFHCDLGYILHGCDELKCNDTGEWSHSTPICTGKIAYFIFGLKYLEKL